MTKVPWLERRETTRNSISGYTFPTREASDFPDPAPLPDQSLGEQISIRTFPVDRANGIQN
jgi:hypothetical protein